MIIDTDKFAGIPDKEMAELQMLMSAEMIERSKRIPVAWLCGECNFQNKEADVVISHLIEEHKYPAEDAMLSTMPVHVV